MAADSQFLVLVNELSDPRGRSIVALVPELAAAIRNRKNKRDAEALLLFILSSPKATQHVWLTRPVYNSKKPWALPEPSNHIKKRWLGAAGHPLGPERRRLEDAMDAAARASGGFSGEIFAAIVDKLAASAPRLPRSEDSATARQARRQRAKLGLSRPPGRPRKSGQL
jgi:hypothetical protein